MKTEVPALHVIAFDVPWPVDYGGVIDVFCKVKALTEAGVKVILHCFRYGRPEAEELRRICDEVHYYPRKTGLVSQLTFHPYIVESRRSDALAERLLQDNHPVLAEGLHCSGILLDRRFTGRRVFVRTTNIEHEYYHHLAAGERKLLKKWFFRMEGYRLKRYEPILQRADNILAISPPDQQYFENRFGKEKVSGIYAFHQFDKVESLPGQGTYILYHGRLDVAENYNAVRRMLPLFDAFHDLPLWIAGMNPPGFLVREIKRHSHVRLVENPSPEGMQGLIRNAHAHLLLTDQPTGLKLKLLAALFRGRFVIVNDTMVTGTGLEPLCYVGNQTEELLTILQQLHQQSFSEEEMARREVVLRELYSNRQNAGKIVALLTSR